jgi:hypothetical protein
MTPASSAPTSSSTTTSSFPSASSSSSYFFPDGLLLLPPPPLAVDLPHWICAGVVWSRQRGNDGASSPAGAGSSHRGRKGCRLGLHARSPEGGGPPRRRGLCGRTGRDARAHGTEEAWVVQASRAGSWEKSLGERRENPQEWGRARGVPHSAVAAGAGTVHVPSSF